MSASLVGSEMCIRDRPPVVFRELLPTPVAAVPADAGGWPTGLGTPPADAGCAPVGRASRALIRCL
eukprot:10905724-Alexandrium_andersonii.AAC.1